jgi:DNA-binding Xre family transcriptional regulator
MRASSMIRLRVKEVAKQQGMSMGRLSRDAGVAYNTIRTIYKDPFRQVTTTTLDKLAKALGVPATELIEDVPDTRE